MSQIQCPASARKHKTVVPWSSALALGFSLLALLVLTGCNSKKSSTHIFRLIDHLDQVEFLASPFPELIPGGKTSAAADKIKKILDKRKQLVETLIEPGYWAALASHPLALKCTKFHVLPREVGLSTRDVFVAPPQTVFRIQRKISAGSVLEFGLGILNARTEDLKGAIQFKILASSTSTGLPRVIYSRTLPPGILRRDQCWIDSRVDLKDFTDQTIWLTFETAESGVKESPSPFVSAWVNPVIIEKPAAPRLSVILISLDTLRPDHLSCYGYGRPTSPHLDNLAKEGVLFKTAISQAPYTLPSHMSMLTSLYPSFHGVNFVEDGVALDESVPTLADFFYRQGYRTWAITGGGQMDRSYGFSRGFENYIQYTARTEDLEKKVGETIAFLEDHKDGDVFVFFHVYGTHVPYHPRSSYNIFVDPDYEGPADGEIATIANLNKNIASIDKNDVEHVIALYDGTIRQTDEAIGRLLDYLKDSGLDQRTLVIVTSDHGEELLEHSKIAVHSHTLFDELLRVPLIFRGPGIPARDSALEEQVQSIDITPTILELARIDPGRAKFQGRSLLSLIQGKRKGKAEKYAFSERLPSDDTHWRSVRTPNYKFILLQDVKDGTSMNYFFFDLLKDPGEQKSLVLSPGRRKAWEDRIQFLIEANRRNLLRAPEKKRTLDSKTLETLRALGYIQ
jgi:arylsulfatase A-like enzyme